MTPVKKLLTVMSLLLILITVFQLSGIRQTITIEFLRQNIQQHYLLGLMLFIAAFALGNLIQIPGWIFLAAAVITLGQWYGGLITYVAAIVACLFTYLIVDKLAHNTLREFDSSIARKLFMRLDQHPISSIVALRMIFQTMPILNYSLAMSGIKFRHYLLGTLLGLPLPILLYCIFFDFLAKNLLDLTPFNP